MNAETGAIRSLVQDRKLTAFSVHPTKNETLIATKSDDSIIVERVDLQGKRSRIGSVVLSEDNYPIQLLCQADGEPPILLVSNRVYFVDGPTKEPAIEFDADPILFAARMIDRLLFVGVDDQLVVIDPKSERILTQLKLDVAIRAIGGEGHDHILLATNSQITESSEINGLMCTKLEDGELKLDRDAVHASLLAVSSSSYAIDVIDNDRIFCSGYTSSYLANLKTGEIETWSQGDGAVSRDRSKLAIVEGWRIAIRDATNMERINAVRGHDQFFAMKFDEENQTLHTKQNSGRIFSWSLVNGELLNTKNEKFIATDYDQNVSFDLSTSRDKESVNRFAITECRIASDDQVVHHFQTDHEQPPSRLYPIAADRLAMLSADQKAIGVYVPGRRLPVHQIHADDFADSQSESHFDSFLATKNGYAIVSFSQSKNSFDNDVRVVRLRDEQLLYSIDTMLLGQSWNTETDQLAHAEGGVIVIRTLSTGEITHEVQLVDQEKVSAVSPFHFTCISPDGKWVVCSFSTMDREDPNDPLSELIDQQHGFWLIDAQTGVVVDRFYGHSEGNISFLFSEKSTFLFSADRHGQIHQWELPGK